MDITKIEVDKEDRKVTVHLEQGEYAEFQPFGLDFITNTSENVLKKDVRMIGEVLVRDNYFKDRFRDDKPTETQISVLEMKLARFIGKPVVTTLD